MYKHRHVVTEHKTSRDLHTMAKSNGHRTAEPVCSVKHGEGLIIITRLDTGAAPVLSLARTLSRETHTLVPFIHIHTHTHTSTNKYTPYKWVIKGLPLGEKKMLKWFPSNQWLRLGPH